MGRLIDALFELQHEHGHLSDEALRDLAAQLNVPLYRLQELVSFYPHFRRTPPPRVQLNVCRDVACRMAGSEEQRRALVALCEAEEGVAMAEVSCLGRCEQAPAAAIGEVPVRIEALDGLKALLRQPPALAPAPLDPSRRFAADPYAADDAGEEARYGVLRRWVTDGNDADALVQTLVDSGLRGMGGAGFPTGLKWRFVRAQPAERKFVVCNADESEPGTFKDRVVLAELPHLVIEGMVLAGLCCGAREGIVFIRHEYEPERLRLQAAIEQARATGVLGDDAAGSGQPFDIRVAVSPGGYILGEETALLECLEDKRGEPRNKPPYPGSHGLWGEPTLINNVETLAYVPLIAKEGAAAWKARGVRGCGGLKMIALSGDVARPGVYEVPMGTSIGELIEQAGGVSGGTGIKAIAPGGASSNFVGPEGAALPLDFDALAKAGTMLGSGAVLVLAEGRDILDLAANVVRFFRNESCGKCVPCRIGSEKAVQILEQAVNGRGSRRQLRLLDDLRSTMEQTSICGLGQVALNPFTSMRDAFEDEVRARFGEP